jgi:hypothetical protein
MVPPLETPVLAKDMTLRDWFAGQAMAGMASISLDDGDMIMGWADMAKAAYNASDALMIERERGE